jgi:hypothetical protein
MNKRINKKLSTEYMAESPGTKVERFGAHVYE